MRLIGSPSVLNAAIQPYSPSGSTNFSSHELSSSPLFSAKGFGRDKERRKKGVVADVIDFNANIDPPQILKRSMSLESANNENAHLLSLLQRSTTAAPANGLDGIGAGIFELERARTSIGVAGPFERSNKMIFNSDEGSLDDGSMYAESMSTSMEFESVNTFPGGGVVIAPLSNAPMAGFKHKGGGSSDKGGGSMHKSSNNSSKDNTNTNSPREYNNSSMENSVDSMEGHAVAALERINLSVKDKRGGRGFLEDNRPRRKTVDPEDEQRLEKYASPLFTHKGSSRHIPPLAPPIKNAGDAGDVEPENKGVVLTGHTGSVNHLAKLGTKADLELMDFVVSAGSDSTVRIWNVAKGLCVGRCTDVEGSGVDQGAISALATVKDGESGSSIVTGTDNGYLRLWDLGRSETGDARLQSKFHAHKGRITCIVSEKEGARELVNTPRLVSSGTDRTIRMWDPRLRKPQVFLFKGHTDTVNTLLLDASASCVVSGGRDQSVRIWDIRTGRQRSSMMEHFGSVNCLAMSKDKNNGSYLSSGRDGVICLWKRGSGEFTKSLRQGPNAKAVGCLAVKAGEGSDGGNRSVSGGSDGSLRVWDHARGKCLRVLGGGQGSSAAVTTASWSNMAGHVLSGSIDGKVRLWDCRAGRCVHYIQAHSGAVTSLLVTAGGFCVTSGRDGALRIWRHGGSGMMR